ncbi:MAG: hypothetical protein AABZ56_08200 [Bacteroidota bacterium]
MTQSFTPNDLIKNLYEPQTGINDLKIQEVRSELAAFQQVQNALDQAYIAPSERVINRILDYSKHKESIQS